MQYLRAIGWGIVIYAIMYLVWNGLVLYGISGGIAPRVASLATLIITALIAGRALRLNSAADILPFSILWTIVVAALDAVYTVPYAGWGVYTDWNLWVGYALVLLLPLLAPYVSRRG